MRDFSERDLTYFRTVSYTHLDVYKRQAEIDGKEIVKVISVPNKLVNIVVK